MSLSPRCSFLLYSRKSCILARLLQFDNWKRASTSTFRITLFKAKINGITGCMVVMVIYHAWKITTTYSPMIGHLCDTKMITSLGDIDLSKYNCFYYNKPCRKDLALLIMNAKRLMFSWWSKIVHKVDQMEGIFLRYLVPSFLVCSLLGRLVLVLFHQSSAF